MKAGKRAEEEQMGEHGRKKEAEIVRGSRGDFSYYTLEPGSPFRKYCDSYSRFVKKFQDRVELFANVDVIGNPERTWEVQLYFEQEHGLKLVPVVHHGASIKWVDKYLERGHDIIGLGGMARRMGREELMQWLDRVFFHLCPSTNGFKPIVRLHGFAVTAWEHMVRYPWFSVDSTSWVKYSAYGWLILPDWKRDKFRFDLPPLVVNLSWRSPFKKDRNKHLDSLRAEDSKDNVRRWLKHCGIPMGKVDGKGEVIEKGVVSDYGVRSAANLHYYCDLEASLPKWPWPLAGNMRRQRDINSRGFGIGV
jgi:hypothetical protein